MKHQQRDHNDPMGEQTPRPSKSGLIFVDANGEIRWMDEHTRRSVDGELHNLQFPLQRDEHAMDCFVSTIEVIVKGRPKELYVVQESSDVASRRDFHSLIDRAVQEIMSDCSWLTHPLTEKLKAWCQVAEPNGRDAGLGLLTAREREILALICEGRSDADMSVMLHLRRTPCAITSHRCSARSE
jgi:ATP/maltotriose-dependent transcriptional regulator MalT